MSYLSTLLMVWSVGFIVTIIAMLAYWAKQCKLRAEDLANPDPHAYDKGDPGWVLLCSMLWPLFWVVLLGCWAEEAMNKDRQE